MEIEKLYDENEAEKLDIKSRRISMIETYGENFCEKTYITKLLF